MSTPTFIFAGGGTGGHLYPGLAIAERLRARLPTARVLFLCSDREIDRKVLEPDAGPFAALPARPFAVGLRPLCRFVSSWPGAVRAARAAIREAARAGPVRVIALGGFVAAPAVQGARAERVPITLVNLDAAPGKANRWIAKRIGSGTAFSTVADAAHPSWRLLAPIVRSGATAMCDKPSCRRELGLNPDAPVLMVTGGSQGAASVNRLIAAIAQHRPGAFNARSWQVLHQTGKDEEADPRAAYERAGIRALVAPFTRQMGLWWGAADLAVPRSGAGAVAEAWCNRVPCVFLPYPHHADDHQRLNAQELERRRAAIVCNDRVEPAANMADAGTVIAGLLEHPACLASMAAAAAGLPPADGATVIAEHLAAAVMS